MNGVIDQPILTDAGRASRIRWTHIAPTLLVVWIVAAFDKSNMSIVINDHLFLNELDLTGKAPLLGWLSTVVLLGYGLSAPLWGMVVTRLGARKTAAVSLVIWAVTCFMCGVATNYGEMLFARLVLGIGEGALFPLTVAMVANWFALKERGRATGFWWIGTMIGPMFTGVLVTTLVLMVGWRWQFHVMGLMALVVPLPMVWFLVRDKPLLHPGANAAEISLVDAGSLENNRDAPGQAIRGTRNIWKSYRFWLVVVALSCNNMFFWGWSSWLPTYLKTVRGFSFSISGYLTFVIFGFAVLTILTMGVVSDRLFRRAHLAGIGWVIGAASLIGAAYAPDRTICIVLMIMALCGQQIGVSCAEALMHSIVGKKDMGRTQGVRACIVQMFGAVAPAMIGYFVAFTGNFTAGFVVLAVAMGISAICMLKLWREGF
jgi:sugar phosphate permease